ncbi:MAG: cell division protein FtsZ [Candidatus Dormibacteraceae bacterium]
MSAERADRQDGRARIKVVGCGGGGGNAVNRMISAALKGVEFIAVNTDLQALERCNADIKVNIGRKLTRGLGSGGDWTKGRDAADESRAELTELVKDSDMVFITAGMGGGTGTGSSSVVAEVAKEQGALTIGVVTRPFRWEGKVRAESAEEGVTVLREKVDALIVIPNDRLTQVVDKRTTLEEAFKIADDVLRQGVQGIADLIVNPGVINLDFADVKSVMSDAGAALMGIGFGAGENRAEDAAKQAVASPLLETSIDGARGILFNVTAGTDITLFECEKAAEIIKASADPGANIIFGVVNDERMQDEVKITVVATGFDVGKRSPAREAAPGRAQERERERERAVASTYRENDSTTIEYAPRSAAGQPDRPAAAGGEGDDLDIPAFLRNRF